MIWLVLGSSPRAPYALRAARDDYRVDSLITTNAGIMLEPAPEVYFLSDSEACRLYGQHAATAARNGAKCVTLRRIHAALQLRGVEWFHEFILPEFDEYEPFQLSGTFCLEYAAKRATTVLLCGMDGYDPSRQQTDYFDPSIRLIAKPTHVNMTERVVVPITRRVVAKYPAVEWICYGTPLYSVESDRWTVRGV